MALPSALSSIHDPYLDAGMRGWIVNIARKNYGRIANYEIDDLIQEGYFCYYKCHSRYIGKKGLQRRDGTPCRYLPVKNPDKIALKHFQSLVCTTFGNSLSTLAFRQPSGWEQPISSLGGIEQTTEEVWEQLVPPEQEVASVSALLQNAPWEIKQLFQLLVNDALELTGFQRFKSGRRRGTRETTNQYFCRLLGIPPENDYDICGAVERHFLG